jgi:hypothetical protein
VEQVLQDNGAISSDVVMVGNPPGYYIATRRSAIVIPEGGINTLLEAAKAYHPRFVILEKDHPQGLNQLYVNPGDNPGLIYLTTYDDTHIYLVE